jgi:hypothetical protein
LSFTAQASLSTAQDSNLLEILSKQISEIFDYEYNNYREQNGTRWLRSQYGKVWRPPYLDLYTNTYFLLATSGSKKHRPQTP